MLFHCLFFSLVTSALWFLLLSVSKLLSLTKCCYKDMILIPDRLTKHVKCNTDPSATMFWILKLFKQIISMQVVAKLSSHSCFMNLEIEIVCKSVIDLQR